MTSSRPSRAYNKKYANRMPRFDVGFSHETNEWIILDTKAEGANRFAIIKTNDEVISDLLNEVFKLREELNALSDILVAVQKEK